MLDKMNLKIVILCFLATLFIGALLYDLNLKPESRYETKANVSKLEVLPEVRFNTVDNLSYRLSSLNHPVILIHFWASWCSTCKMEYPDLLELVEMSKGNVALVSLSIDKDLAKMKKALNSLKKEMPDKVVSKNVFWVWDNEELSIAKQFAVKKVPETIVINQDREMIHKFVGKTDWLGEELQNIIYKEINQEKRS
jgi:thiol-disulfide isomerase/thioredoxin